MPEEEAHPFVIQGPDEDGHVWIVSPPGEPEAWGRNLGTKDQAAEIMCQWLGAIDYGESD